MDKIIDINSLKLGRHVNPDKGFLFFSLKKRMNYEEYLIIYRPIVIYFDKDYILSINTNDPYSVYIILNSNKLKHDRYK
jgi:hypothetical protein